MNAILAAVGGAAAILAAMTIPVRPPDLPPQPHPVLTGDIPSFGPSAPHWNALTLAKATHPHEAYGEVVSARVRIDETRAARIGTPLPGRVNKVFVELGQAVTRGAPLFSVASAQWPTLRYAFAAATLNLKVARTERQRVHDLVAAQLAPRKEELAASALQREAVLTQREALSKQQALRVVDPANNDEFTVTAPRNGVVVAKTLLPYQQVDPSMPLIEIADLSTVWVVADLLESDAANVAPGTVARITLPALPGFSVETHVESVAAAVDPERRTIPVRVRLNNVDARLKPNQYAEMQFRVAVPSGVAEVASTALLSDGQTQFLYVQVTPWQLVRRDVTAGADRAGRVVISRGLEVGETVVEQGASLLENQIPSTL